MISAQEGVSELQGGPQRDGNKGSLSADDWDGARLGPRTGSTLTPLRRPIRSDGAGRTALSFLDSALLCAHTLAQQQDDQRHSAARQKMRTTETEVTTAVPLGRAREASFLFLFPSRFLLASRGCCVHCSRSCVPS